MTHVSFLSYYLEVRTGIFNLKKAFQGEIGRRILRLSESHSTLATRVALKWPSVTARILTRKLNLLSKVSSGGESIVICIHLWRAIGNPQSLRLVQECLSLENMLDCHGVTDLVLKADNNPQGLRGIKKLILNTDWKISVSVKQVETRAHPLLPKSLLTTPGPNCGTWLWIIGTRHGCTTGSLPGSHQTQLW